MQKYQILYFIIFLVPVLSVLSLVHWFLIRSHLRFLAIDNTKTIRIITAFYVFMFLGFIVSVMLTRLSYAWPAKTAYYIFGMWLPLLSWLVILTAVNWLLYGLLSVWVKSFNPALIHWIFIVIAGLMTIIGGINYYRVAHTVTEIPIANLPKAFENKKILLISDLHIGGFHDADFVRSHVDRLNAQKPDLIVIAGDLYDGSVFDSRAVAKALSELKAPDGIFFVHGNHEEMLDMRLLTQQEDALDFIRLDNNYANLNGLTLLGINHSDRKEREILRDMISEMPDSIRKQPRILLCHEPITDTDYLNETGIDLQLSGHTHNGQFFPFNLVTRAIYGNMSYGLSKHGKLWSYTSSGLGLWGPAYRFMSRCEFVEIRLKPTDPD